MTSEKDTEYMKRALTLAQKALSEGEVPVGAVAVWEDDEKRNIVSEIVGEGYNKREYGKNALYHAEMIAIYNACEKLGGWRLHKCTLYITLEPCIMCAGAIISSRIKRVVFGASDNKSGAFGGKTDVMKECSDHYIEVEKGVLQKESEELLKSFFENLRKSGK